MNTEVIKNEVTEEKLPITDLKEAVIAGFELSIVVASLVKDGIDIEDFAALYAKIVGDEDFKAKLAAAADNYKNIIPQARDIDLVEGIELAQVALPYIPKLVDAFKK